MVTCERWQVEVVAAWQNNWASEVSTEEGRGPLERKREGGTRPDENWLRLIVITASLISQYHPIGSIAHLRSPTQPGLGPHHSLTQLFSPVSLPGVGTSQEHSVHKPDESFCFVLSFFFFFCYDHSPTHSNVLATPKATEILKKWLRTAHLLLIQEVTFSLAENSPFTDSDYSSPQSSHHCSYHQ